MIHYALVGLAACIFSIGLLLLKNPFFNMALASTAMVNALLDPISDEDTKHSLVSRQLLRLISRLGIFLLALSALVVAAYIPFLIYEVNVGPLVMETTGIWFYGSMLAGGLLPFLCYRPKSSSDYSELSKLLHRMILNNQHLSRQLLSIEKKLFLKEPIAKNQPFLVVTGLARSGTTALTQLLFRTGRFHSLSYANMPFLLAPNLWRKIYNPKNAALKERAHGDSIQFGFDTVEALEEYFFKVMTNDGFIHEDGLIPHELNEANIRSYQEYRSLISVKAASSIYLAKNNNLLLRLQSMLELEPELRVVMMIRHPLEHASSLLKQHLRFSKLQTEDPFVLEYMNWLGHHEFGLNHKPFQLPSDGERGLNPNELNYWLSCWIAYYSFAKRFISSDKVLLVAHQQLAESPQTVLNKISASVGVTLSVANSEVYPKTVGKEPEIDPLLISSANALYAELLQLSDM